MPIGTLFELLGSIFKIDICTFLPEHRQRSQHYSVLKLEYITKQTKK